MKRENNGWLEPNI